MIEKLRAEYRVLISETNVFELSATPDREIRKQLIDVCEQLLGFGECLMPHNWILEQMAKCNSRYKERFRWTDVDIRAPMIERELFKRELLSQDAIVEESRSHAKAQKKELKQIFDEAREEFKSAFSDEVKDMPLVELIRIYKAQGGPFWLSVAGSYERANLIPIDEAEARAFIGRCPPFHALCLSMVIPHYQHGIPWPGEKPKYDAGPFDLFMTIYLPYCDLFVTDDPGQRNAMQAIVEEIGIQVTVISYDDLAKNLLAAIVRVQKDLKYER